MMVPFIDLNAMHAEIADELRAAVDEVFRTSAFASGPFVERFETEYAEYTGTEHCVGVSSGTAALEILLRAFGIGPGDEVVLPANTFVATAEAIAHAGAKPVFADVREDTANLDPDAFANAIGPKTRAVIPVHMYGQPAEMPALLELAKAHHLVVIEDASQSHGATVGERKTGRLADAAAFSFYPAKNLGACGEAGAITTNDPEIAKKARMLRDHGSDRKYHHQVVGRNDRMDGIQAAVLSVKLRHLDRWNDNRIQLAEVYGRMLEGRESVKLFSAVPGTKPVHHLFAVRVPGRDQLQIALTERGIGTGIHYPIPLHLQPAFAGLNHQPGDFPVSERLAAEILSLPMYPQLQSSQVEFVAKSLMELIA